MPCGKAPIINFVKKKRQAKSKQNWSGPAIGRAPAAVAIIVE